MGSFLLNLTRQVLLKYTSKCQFGTLAFHFWHFRKCFHPQNQHAYSDFLIRSLYRAEGLRKTIPKTLWWNEYLFANHYNLLEPMRYGNTKSSSGSSCLIYSSSSNCQFLSGIFSPHFVIIILLS